MWYFSIRYLGDRPRYACCLSPFTLGSPTSLGPQRNACRLCICETKKSLCGPKYVVSTATSVAAPRDLIPRFRLIYQLLDYEKAHFLSPTPSDRSQSDEEWNRRRKLLDEAEDHDDAPNKEARLLTRPWRIVFWPASRPLLRLALVSVWVPLGSLDTRRAREQLPSRVI
jgi:hypothetical protein